MEKLVEFLMGLSVEYAGSISTAVVLVGWNLRTLKARAEFRAWFDCRRATAQTFFRAKLPIPRNPWTWPMILAIPVGIALEATSVAGLTQTAAGALASVYVCVGVYFIVRGGGQRVINRLR